LEGGKSNLVVRNEEPIDGKRWGLHGVELYSEIGTQKKMLSLDISFFFCFVFLRREENSFCSAL